MGNWWTTFRSVWIFDWELHRVIKAISVFEEVDIVKPGLLYLVRFWYHEEVEANQNCITEENDLLYIQTRDKYGKSPCGFTILAF